MMTGIAVLGFSVFIAVFTVLRFVFNPLVAVVVAVRSFRSLTWVRRAMSVEGPCRRGGRRP